VLPSGLPGGSIVLEGFVGNLFRTEPGSSQEVDKEIKNQHGSNGAINMYSPYSKIIFLVFKLIIAWLSKAQSKLKKDRYGKLLSTMSMTSKSSMVCTPSRSIGIPFNIPIGTTLFLFSNYK
jgi:hypothetical protein